MSESNDLFGTSSGPVREDTHTGPVLDLVATRVPADQPTPKSADDSKFDWSDEDCVILREQPATAVYVNVHGGLVIRQERQWDQDEDVFIFLATRDAVERVINAMQRELGPDGHPNLAAPRDRSR